LTAALAIAGRKLDATGMVTPLRSKGIDYSLNAAPLAACHFF
jgi:flavin-dependent dehydrogenase